MWTVIYMGDNKRDTLKTKMRLEEEGFLLKVRAIGKEGNQVFEILVPNGEALDAHDVLKQIVY